MIKVVTSAERHTSNKGWIHSEFSFSFADYDDPSNAHFGCMLAHNDNELKPEQGFKKHPHQDLEIVTYVIEGTLHHSDSIGNEQDIRAGTVQVISAGKGLEHEERNPKPDQSTRFLQMWFLPDRRGVEPSYQKHTFAHGERLNNLLPIVSGTGKENALKIMQDVNLYLCKLETGNEISYPQRDDRRTHIYVISGHVEVTCQDGNFPLGAGDAARIHKSCDLNIRGTSSDGVTEFIMADLP